MNLTARHKSGHGQCKTTTVVETDIVHWSATQCTLKAENVSHAKEHSGYAIRIWVKRSWPTDSERRTAPCLTIGGDAYASYKHIDTNIIRACIGRRTPFEKRIQTVFGLPRSVPSMVTGWMDGGPPVLLSGPSTTAAADGRSSGIRAGDGRVRTGFAGSRGVGVPVGLESARAGIRKQRRVAGRQG